MNIARRKLLSASNYILTFLKFSIIAGFTGLLGGAIGGAFHKTVEIATEFRGEHLWLIWLLPIAGLLIVFLYRLLKLKTDPGTNRIIKTVRTEEEIPLSMAPLIFISTAITHLFGGSAGREGAALQLGGSIGFASGKLFKLDEKNMPLVVMCGMSAVFSALFGTPLTAVFFAMEVISVGVIYYSALVPCAIASYVALFVSSLYGNEPIRLIPSFVPETSFVSLLQVSAIAASCAVLSIIFCTVMKYSHIYSEKLIKNDYLRIFVGGLAVTLLTFAIGNYDYNGAGMNIVENAINGEVVPYAFALKMVFTALTISFGFKGGEIVPTLFIGATFGATIGPLFGLPASFSATVGIVALFVGVVNSPMATVILAIELFGSNGLLLYAAAIFISFMLSGYYSLYSGQKIIYSKLKAEYINISAK